jgi:site-specific DNA-cytosine methylase
VTYDNDKAGTMSKSQTLAVCVLMDQGGGVINTQDDGGIGTLRAPTHGHEPIIAFNMHKSGNEASSLGVTTDRIDCMRAAAKSPMAIQSGMSSVRRLTPKECERLQGWPDDHTLVPYRGKPMADGPRYKIIGNGWALPCVQWIARRIVEEMRKNCGACNGSLTGVEAHS